MGADFRRAAALALVLVVGAGCENAQPRRDPFRKGRGPPPDEVYEAAAPRAALVRWHRSLVGGDKEQYLACFVGSEDELVLSLAVFAVVQASYAFHDAVVNAYGPEAWQVFQRSKSARVGLFPRDETWPMKITLVRTGQVAFGYLPQGPVPLHLAREKSAWRIHAGSLVPPGHEAETAASYLFRWAAALEELTGRLGKPETKPKRITPEASKELFRKRLQEKEYPSADETINFYDAMMH